MLKEISIEIIRKCPNQCLHCSSLSNSNCIEKISIDKFKSLIDSAKGLGLKTVCFSGGEPFLHPDICDMINYVSGQGLNSYIYSSGIYLDQNGNRTAIPESILKQIANKVTKIILNIEAIDENVYDSIMGTKNCFNFLLKTIRAASRLKIQLEAHFVPMKLNINQVEKVIDFCFKENIAKISFLRLVAHGRAKINQSSLELSASELNDLKLKLLDVKNKNIYPIRIGTPILGETDESHCEAANGKLNIKYDGKVYPCEVFKNLDSKVILTYPSSIYDEDLITIYNTSNYLIQIRNLINKFSCEGNCESCMGQYILKQLNEEKKNG